MKTAKVINKENSINCPWMIHYTILYRSKEYVETLQGEYKDKYNVGDSIEIETFKDKGKLRIVFKKIL